MGTLEFPGKSIFDLAGQTFTNCYFVNMHFSEGDYGVVDIYRCGGINFVKLVHGALYMHISGDLYSGIQESETWNERQRNIEPYKRGSMYTYNGFAFDDHVIFSTSNGSRFLSLKRTHRYESLSTSATNDYPGYVGAILKDKVELQSSLEVALPLMGVPSSDVSMIISDILNKFTNRKEEVR